MSDQESSSQQGAPSGGPFRAGTVAVVGRPNVGKSTLVNAVVGFRVSIVSRRPQTTRHRILGISTEADGQIVFADTPGLHASGKRAINRYMNRTASGALLGVDLAVLVVEAAGWREDDQRALAAIREAEVPCVLVINKVDRIKDKSSLLPLIAELSGKHSFAAVVPISAQRGVGVADLRRSLLALLPEREALYGEDEVTDKSERFLAAELIREQLMRQLGDELPYATTVEIEGYREDGRLLRIDAVIWVERDGQKAIVIGAGGSQMRTIGQGARLAMERLLDRKVFLQLWCKVRENWSDDEAQLKRFGYTD
ncbi:GTPase Era [Pseudomarimonas salicorniae]|uniref:GTPase Era n=1 Tax=Pseudomarimonas salicorniae TaxID=2933270 RepID=A0ABT0GJU6_9GAMM|nr:GTPase Era [Lysobacter sp. CAU 1642]MCK7594803.1 GTPase Era [Lysobacter sp. CAU 1642]